MTNKPDTRISDTTPASGRREAAGPATAPGLHQAGPQEAH